MASTSLREPLEPELFSAVRDFVGDARDHYARYREESSYISKLFDLHDYDEFDTGFPHITRNRDSEVPDYKGVFGVKEGRWTPIAFGDWPSFGQLKEIAERSQRWQGSFLIDPAKRRQDRARRFWLHEVSDLPLEVFDRLMHLYGEHFSEDQLLEVYCQLEQGALAERLPITIAVPIVLTKFLSDSIDLGAGQSISRMPKGLHLARVSRYGRPSSSVNEIVANSATHMFLLEDWEMPNFKGHLNPPYQTVDWYPIEQIDRFFDALRIVTGTETGYAELFLLPVGQEWAFGFRANLPAVVRGAHARRYPSHFDDFGWLVERDAVDDKQIAEIRRVLSGVAGRSSLELAGRRLSTGMLRETEDDAILDLLIGLEAILSDKDKSELTYRLALRTAAVLSAEGLDPGIVFGQVKRLYNYRSAVAHGDAKKAAKLREMDVNGEPVSSVTVATGLLRGVISQLVGRPDLASASDIDSKLILRSLGGGNRAKEDSEDEDEGSAGPDEVSGETRDK